MAKRAQYHILSYIVLQIEERRSATQPQYLCNLGDSGHCNTLFICFICLIRRTGNPRETGGLYALSWICSTCCGGRNPEGWQICHLGVKHIYCGGSNMGDGGHCKTLFIRCIWLVRRTGSPRGTGGVCMQFPGSVAHLVVAETQRAGTYATWV